MIDAVIQLLNALPERPSGEPPLEITVSGAASDVVRFLQAAPLATPHHLTIEIESVPDQTDWLVTIEAH